MSYKDALSEILENQIFLIAAESSEKLLAKDARDTLKLMLDVIKTTDMQPVSNTPPQVTTDLVKKLQEMYYAGLDKK